MLDSSYKLVDCCENCKKVFRMSDWNNYVSFYCHVDGAERPLCGSGSMKECFGEGKLYDRTIWDNNRKRWIDWSFGRRVKPFGYCELHERKDDDCYEYDEEDEHEEVR